MKELTYRNSNVDTDSMIAPPIRYCAHYCEENIWHLAQHPDFSGVERAIVLISNIEGISPFWMQRAGASADGPVWWDYHVILLVNRNGWLVYDLDTTLPLPTDAPTYLRETFQWVDALPELLRPRFALFGANEYVESFSSDRSHMRDGAGQWLSPPPEWPPVDQGTGEDFLTFVQRRMASGPHISLEEMSAQFGHGKRRAIATDDAPHHS